ncbi:MAG: Ig-like domain-containing protein [Accumulibacter sp.]|jgi:VCBS repeat-containing protein|uniref:Ig-like domain-containing protein n=1 Tax=Accumulibacter sp. TaxID=2053492 RepID=UPI002FC2DBF7
MADLIPVARVSAIQGKAYIRQPDGSLRPLQVGDMVFEGDVIVAGRASRVELSTPDGRAVLLRANETLTMDGEVSAAIPPSRTEAALSSGAADVSKVIQALTSGASLDDLLDETAAGTGTPGADGGPSFVRLLRIAENVDPLVFEFGTARGRVIEDAGGGAASAGADLLALAESSVAGRDTVVVDSTAPTISIDVVAGDDLIDDAEDQSVTLSGSTSGVENGQVVSITLVDAGGTVVYSGSAVVGNDAWSIAGVDLSALPDGAAYTVTASVSDAAGNAATPATRPVSTVDSSAPTISIAVVAGDDVIDDSEDQSVTLSGSTSGVENGQVVSVTLVDTSGTVVYSGSALVGNDAWSIAGVDLSALPDGAGYTVTASVSDAAGNAATPATRPVSTVDSSAPTITIDVVAGDDLIDDSEDQSVTLSGSTSGVENGQVVSITLVDAGGTVVYSGSALVGNDAWSIAGVDLSALPDGAAYTVTASVSDAAGNAATPATRLVSTLDSTAPAITIDAVAGDDVIDDAEDDSVTLSGSTSGVENGQVVSVTLVDAGGTVVYSGSAVVSGGTWSLPGVDLSALPDGANYTVTASVSDAAGNAATPASRPVSTVDSSAPTITIDVVAGDDLIDDAEDDSVTLSGSTTGVENGQTVSVTLVDAGGTVVYSGSAVVSGGTWSLPGVDLSALPDGAAYTVTASVSDAAGNAATPATRPVSTLDSTAPTISIAVVAGDDVIDDSEDQSVTLSGSTTGVENGQVVSVTLVDAGGTVVYSGSAVVSGSTWSLPGVDLSALPDGAAYTVTANAFDAAGNAATPASRPVSTVDSTAPTITIDVVAGDDLIDDAEDDSVTLSGSTTGVENGQTVSVTLVDTSGTVVYSGSAVVGNDAWSLPGVDLSALPDGANYTVTASVSDAAGNAATPATRPVSTLDSSAPTITIDVVAGDDVIDDSEDQSVTLSGSTSGVENGQVVSITLVDAGGTVVYSGSAVVSGSTWSLPGVDLSALPDGAAYTVTANVSDAAGNAATPATRPVSTLDSTAPTISIAVVAGDDVIDDSEDQSVTLSGSTTGVENGQVVSVTLVDAGGTVVYSGSAVVSGGTWSLPGVDLSALPDGANYTVTASVSDAAGNAATPASRPVSTVDSTAPTITIDVVAGDDLIDDAEDDSVTLSGSTTGVENGQVVSVTLVDSGGTVVYSGSAVVGNDAWSIAGVDLSALPDGAGYTVTASVSDAAGNAATPATRPVSTLDSTAPTISIAVVAGDDVIDDSEDQSVTLSGSTTGVENGQVVSVTLVDAGGTVVYSGSALVGNDAWSIAGVDLSALPDGANYTVTASVSDAAGNAATPATRPVSTVDSSAPTITIDVVAGDDLIDDSEDQSVTLSGSTSGVENGQVVSITLVDAGGTVVYSGSALVGNDAWSIAGVDLSALPDGANYTVTASVSDAAGNAATPATRPVSTLDSTAPTITIDVVAGDDLIDDAEDDSVTLSGSTTGVENGQVVSVTLVDTSGTVVYSGSALVGNDAWSLPGVDLSALPDGAAYTVTANVFDAAGNAATPATRPVSTLDSTAPTISIAVVAGDDVIDDSEDQSVTLSGSTTGVENGQVVSVTLVDAGGTVVYSGSAVVSGSTWSLPGVDLSALPDGANYTVTASVSDAAGNAATPATRPVSTVDSSAPTIAIDVVAGDDVIDDSEDQSVTLSGSTTGVENGQVVSVTLVDAGGTVVYSGSAVVGNDAWSIAGVDLSALPDGANYTVTASVSDAAGNAATPATRPVSTLDSTAPTITIDVVAGDDLIDDAEDDSVTLSGSTTGVENGQVVSVTLVDTSGTVVYSGSAVVGNDAWSIAGVDLSALPDGAAYTVTASVSDAAGNAATPASRPVSTLDSTAPTISIDVVAGDDLIDDAEDDSVTLSGSTTGVENGQVVSVTLVDTSGTVVYSGSAVVSGGTWSLPGVDLSALPDGAAYTVTANVSDAAGNAATPATRPVSTLDSTAPTISIDVVAGDDVIDDSEDQSVTLSGSTSGVENGQVVSVNLVDAGGTVVYSGSAVVGNDAWSIAGVDLSALPDGAAYTVTASVSDAAGNAATPASRPVSTLDSTAPTISIDVVAGDDLIDDAEDDSVTLSGSTTGVENGQVVSVTLVDTSGTVVYSGSAVVSGGTWSLPGVDLSTLPDGAAYTVTASVSDAAGNAATPATRPVSTLDSTAPTISIDVVAGDDVIDDSEDDSVTLSGSTTGVENGQVVSITLVDAGGTVVYSGSAVVGNDAWSIAGVDLSALPDGAAYTVTASVSDAAGNAATPASRPVSTLDSTAPTISIDVVAGDDLIDDAEDDSVTLSGSTTGVENGQVVSVTLVDTSGTVVYSGSAVVSGGTWSLPGVDLSTLPDGAAYTVTASVSDAAGNAATPATRPVSTLDSTAPTISIDVVAGDDVIDDSEDDSVTLSGSTTGVENGQVVSITLVDAGGTVVYSGSAVVGNDAWSIAGVDLSALPDGAAYTVTASVSDAAGNAATPASRPVSTLDSTAPTISIDVVAGDDLIDDAEDDSVTLSGSTTGVENGQVVSVTLVDAGGTVVYSGSAVVSGGTWSLPGVDLSALPDGAAYTVTASVSDAAGNAATPASRPVSTLDSTAPTISIDVVAGDDVIDDSEDDSVTLSGSTTGVENGQVVSVTLVDAGGTVVYSGSAVVGNDAWSLPGVDLSTLPDGANYTVTANVSDAAGNAATPATRPVSTLDSTAPTISIDVVAGDDLIDDAEDDSVTLSGSTTGVENGQVVSVTLVDAGGTIVYSGSAVVGNDAWSIPGVDLSALPDGANYTVTASVSDAAGNAATPATRPVSTLDSTAPTISIDVVAGDDVIDDSEDDSVTLSGSTTGVENGQVVSVTLVDTSGTVVYSGSAVVSGGTWSLPGVDLSALPDGAAYTVTASVSDAAGNAATPASRPVSTLDSTAPTISIDVVAGDDLIDDAEDQSVTLSGSTSGVENGQVVSITLVDAGGTVVYSGSAVVGNDAWSIAGVDLSALTDGAAYTVTASVSDAAGNAATPATRPVSTLDSSAPTISIDGVAGDDVIDDSEDDSVTLSGSTTGVENGQVVSVTLVDTSGTVVYSGSAVVSGGTWSLPGVDLSALPDGAAYTVTASVSDAAGNAATPASRPVSTLDSTAPTISIDVVAGDDLIDDAEDQSVTLSGSTSGVENGQVVSITLVDAGGTVVYSGSAVVGNDAWSIAGVDLSALPDGAAYTVTASVSDAAGNAATPATRPVSTLDSSAPTITIDVVAGDDVIDDSEDQSVTLSGSTSGVENGQVVSITLVDAGGTVVYSGSAVVGNDAWSLPGVDLSALPDGANYTVTASVSDAAGNAATPASRPVSTVDSSAPTISIAVVAGDDVIDDAEDDSVTLSGSTSGVENGQVVSVTLVDAGGTVVYSGSAVVSGGTWSLPGVDLSALPDGANYTVTASVSDAAGNAATPASRPVSTVDSTAPTITIDVVAGDDLIDDAEDDSVTLSGSTTGVENGQVVSVTLVDAGGTVVYSGSAVVSGGNWSLPGVDLSALPDGANYTVTANVSDAAGNAATPATRPVSTVDSSAPTISIAVVAGDDVIDDSEDQSVTLSGSTSGVENGQVVSITLVDTSGTVVYSGSAVVGNDAWSLPGVDLSALPDGANYTVTASVSDAAGNAATPATRPVSTLDSTAPTISIAVVAGDDLIDDAEDDSVTLSGSTTGVENGQVVSVTLRDSGGTVVYSGSAVVGNDAWSIAGVDLSALPDGANYTVTASVSDAAGNAATPATRPVSTLDSTAPTISIAVVAGDDVIDDSEDQSVTLSGSTSGVENGQVVSITLVDAGGTVVYSGSAVVGNDAWSIPGVDLSALPDGAAYTVTASVSDAAGNAATPATRPVSTLDSTAPTISIDVVAGDDVIDDSEDDSVTLSGSTTGVENGQVVSVTLVDAGGTVVYSGSAVVSGSTWSLPGVDLSALPDGAAYTVTANVSDAAGNAATPATRPVSTLDSTAPTISIDVVAGDDVIDDSEDQSVTLSGSTTGVENGQVVSVTLVDAGGTVVYSGSAVVGNDAWSIPGVDLSALPDGAAYTVTANVSDAAGNAATPATRPVSTLDSSAPTISIAVVAGDDVIDDSEDQSVTLSGSTTGVENGQTVSVTLVDAGGTVVYSGSAVVSGGTWSLPGVDLSALPDGANYTVTASVSDAAGNAATPATRPVSTLDSSAPTISIAVVAGDDLIDDSEDQSVTLSGSTTGVENGQVVSVTLVDAGGTVVYSGSAVVGNDAWSIPGVDLSALPDGANYTVTASVSDAAGNAATPATRPVSTLDSTAPTISIDVVAGDDVIDDSEDDSVTLSGSTTGVENGQVVSVTLVDTSGTVVYSGSAVVSGGTWSLPGVDLSALPDGAAYTVTANVSDAAGNAATPATRPVSTLDSTAPTISIDVVAGDDVIDDAEDDSVTLSGSTTGVENGQVVSVTLVDAGGTVVYSGSAVVSGGTWSLPGVDLSALPDGAAYTVTANVSDAAGNAATPATRPVSTLDSTAPTISIDVVAGDDVIDDSEDQSVTLSGSTSGVENGQVVSITLVDAGGTVVYSGSAVVGNDAWSIAGVDLSALPDGAAYTVTANVSDAAGNAATPATRPVSTLDSTAPTISIDVVAGDDVIDDAEDDSVTLSGSTTGVESGQVVSVTLVDTSGTVVYSGSAVVSGGTWSLPGVDLSALPDGAAYTVTASVSDAAGNAATPASRPVSTLDSTAPTISIAVVAGDDVIDDSEDDSVTLSGSTTGVENGQVVSVTLVDAGGTVVYSGSAVVGNDAWSIAGVDLSALPDGANYTVTANVSDAAGNAATPATRPVSTVDSSAPTISIAVVAGDDVIDDSEDQSVTLSGSTSGVENGQVVSITLVDAGGTVVYSGSAVVGNDAWSIAGVDLSALPDGAAYTVTANVSDAAGNAATPATRPVSTLDSTAPTISIDVVAGDDLIDDAEDDSVTLSGSTTGVENGQVVSVTLVDTSGTVVYSGSAVVSGGTWSIAGVDLSALPDGAAYTVTANVSDAAGNAATPATRPVSTLDSTAPTISIDVVAGDDVIDDAEDDSVTLSGSTTGVENGQVVSVTLVDTSGTVVYSGSAVVSGGTWSLPGVDLSALPDGANYTVTASVSDAAGNAATPATRPVSTLDSTAPTISIAVVAGDDLIDDSEDQSVTLSGSTTGVENGQVVSVTLVDAGGTVVYSGSAVVGNDAWSIAGVDLSALPDGANYTVTANVSDAAGNAATPATRPVSTLDSTAPTISIAVVAGDDVIDDSEDDSVTLSGSTTGVENGQVVSVTLVDAGGTVVYSGSALVGNDAWSIAGVDLSALPDGANYTVTASVSDAAGNAATPASRPVSTLDSTAPTISIAVVAGDDVIDDAEDDSVTLSGSTTGVENGQVVSVTLVDTSGTVVYSGSAVVSGGTWSLPGVDLSALPDGAAYTVTASVSDAAGNAATPASRPVSTLDSTAPTISIDVVAGDDVIDDAEDDSVTLSGSTTGVENGQVVSVTLVDTSGTVVYSGSAVVSGGTWSLPGVDLSALPDGANYTVTASVSDAAGNAATPATRPVSTLDSTAPTISIDVVAGDDLIDDSEDQSVTLSGSTTGVENGQVVSVTLVDTSGTVVYSGSAVVSGGTWSLPGVDLSALPDGAAYTVTASVSDAAGNAATPATRPVSTLDSTAPTISIDVVAGDDLIDDAEDDSVTLSGSTSGVENGQVVSVTLVDAGGTVVYSGSAVVSGGTWSLPGVDLSALPDGANYTVTASVSDAAGNAATPASRPVSTVDSSAPTITIDVVAGDDLIDDAEDDSVTLSGSTSGVENGQVVSVTLVDAGGTVVYSGSAVVSGGTWSLPGVDLSALPDGANYTVTASVSDAAGNAATPASRPVSTVDSSAPTITIDVVAGDDLIDDAEDDSVTLSGSTSGVENGQTVSVTLVDAGGTVVYSGSAVVGNDAWSIAGVDLSALPDGANYTVTARVSDAAGNAATPATRPVSTLDSTAPTISIAVVAGDDVIDDSEDDSVTLSGSTTGVENGQVVSVTLVDAGGTVVYSGSAVVSGGTWSLTGVDLSALPDGANYTVTASVSDAAGNAATPATRPVSTLDSTAPTISIAVVAGDDVIDDSEDQSVTLSGSTTGVENGQVVSVTLVDAGGTVVYSGRAVVGNDAWSLPGVDLSALPDGANYTVTASVSDAAGNAATPATRPVSTVDSTPPVPTISLDPNITADDTLNAAEASAPVTLTGRVGGDAQVGDTVTLTINGQSFSGSVVSGPGGSLVFAVVVPGADLAADPDRTIDASISTTDSAGNSGSARTSERYTVDVSAAAAIAVDPITADDVLNDAEATGRVTVTGTVGGDAAPGDTVVLTINGTAYVGSVLPGNTFSIDVAGADLAVDTLFLASVSGFDDAGNPFVGTALSQHTVDRSASATITVDHITADDLLTASEAAGMVPVTGRVGGDAAPGDTVALSINGVSYVTTVLPGNTFSVSVAGSDLAAGTQFTATVSGTDAVGNPFTATDTSTHRLGPVAVDDRAMVYELPAQRIYYNDSAGNIGTVSPATGTRSLIGNAGRVFGDIAVGSTGTLFGITLDSTSVLYSINPATGSATRIGTVTGAGFINALVASPDGRLFAAGNTGDLYQLSTITGAATRIGTFGSGQGSSGDLLFANNALYLSTTNGTIRKFDLATGIATTAVSGLPNDLYNLAQTDVGSCVGSTSSGQMYTIDLAAGTAVRTGVSSGGSPSMYGFAAAPVGGPLVTISGDVTPSTVGQDRDPDGSTLAVVGVVAGDVPAPAATGVGAVIDGTYGTLTIAADGSYGYSLDHSRAAVQSLGAGQVADDVFTYTIRDADGAVDTATLTVQVTGASEVPPPVSTTGGAGADTLTGGIGAETMLGGAGNDLMSAGLGADVFAWRLADRGTPATPAVDTITDFSVASRAAGGDVLDLRDLLQGENSSPGSLDNYLHFRVEGGATTVDVSSSGGFAAGYDPAAVDQQIVLAGVDLSAGGLSTDQLIIQDLLNRNKLITD